MNISRVDIRKLLKYEFQLGHRASEATKNINRAQGAKTVEESTVRRWFFKFRNGDLNLDDKPRPGQPRKINWHSVVNAIELDPTMTTQMLADDFECSHTAIEKILHRGLINKFIHNILHKFFISRQKVAKRPLGPPRTYRNPETEARRYGDCFAGTSTPIAVFGTNPHSRREMGAIRQPLSPKPVVVTRPTSKSHAQARLPPKEGHAERLVGPARPSSLGIARKWSIH